MTSNLKKKKSRGDYYVNKTIIYLKERGFLVERMERNKPTKIKGKFMMIRSDIWYSDLIALSDEGIILIQVKFNDIGWEGNHIATAKKNYKKLPSPIGLQKWVIEWNPFLKIPKIDIVD